MKQILQERVRELEVENEEEEVKIHEAAAYTEEHVYLYLTSAVRDRKQFPGPGKYRLDLDSEVDNVVEACLVQASFPLTDPTVHTDNNRIRYSLSPFTTVRTVQIPVGSYKGDELAVEIMRQLNQDWYAADIPVHHIINNLGQLVDPASGKLSTGHPQFRVSYIAPSKKFVFQVIDHDELPLSTPAFALHIQPLPSGVQQPWRTFNDDLYSLIGYDRELVKEHGLFHAASETYYLVNTTASPLFGPAFNVDTRFAYGIHGDHFSDLRGNRLIVIDIDPLNSNDVALVREGPYQQLQVGNSCFAMVLTKDPAHSNEGMLEINNASYPVKKVFRNGVSRFNQVTVTLRRPDGTVYDFGGLDHFMAIRLTVKRTQSSQPVFERG